MNGRVLRTAEQMQAAAQVAAAKRAEQRGAKEVRKQEADPATKLAREIGTLLGGKHGMGAKWRFERLEALAKKEEFWRALLSVDLDRRFVILQAFAKSWAKLKRQMWEEERPF